nr:odorant receptor 41 [Achelura yunnanensis]
MAFNNVDLYLSRPRNIMRFFGVWLPPKNYVKSNIIYMLIVMMTQYSFVLFEFIYISDVWGDLDEVSEASYLLFTQASVCYKSTVFLINKNKLMSLLEMMELEIFAPQNSEHQKLLREQSQKIKHLCMFFLTSAITTCTLWAMIPLFDDAGSRSFPFKIWMPIDPQRSPHYEIGYVYQMITIYISAFLFIGVDSTTLSMIMFGCAQLEIIMEKVRQVHPMPNSNLKPNERKQLIEERSTLFIECIKHHQEVVKYIEKVEDTYHANIFFQLSGTVGIVCIIGFRISIVDRSSVQFYSMVNYMVTMLSQLFLYCWCGNELTIRSQKLREVLYQTPWYELDVKFGRLLWVAMQRMKRPIIFKAGHYIALSRPTFVSILRSSYSYFAVLNQANK